MFYRGTTLLYPSACCLKSIGSEPSDTMQWLNTRHWTLAKREAAAGYMFVSPWLIGFTLLTLGPMIASLYFSFTQYNIVDPPKWIGTENYNRLLGDPLFWQSLKVT